MAHQHSKHLRAWWIGGGAVALLAALGIGQALLASSAAAQARNSVQAPRFEVDPLWPKPLPNHWILGSAIGVSVDADDHIWIIHRSSATLGNNEKPSKPGRASAAPARRRCSSSTRQGNLLRAWGGPGEGYEWPDSNHGIFVDYKGNVWIGGNGGRRLADPEVHEGRQVPDAVRQEARAAWRAREPDRAKATQAGFAGGSNDGQLRPRRQDLRRPAEPTRPTSPTAI